MFTDPAIALALCALSLVVTARVLGTGRRPVLARDADGEERLLLLGTDRMTRHLIDEIASHPGRRWRLLGAVTTHSGCRVEGTGPWLGQPGDLARVAATTYPTRIVVAAAERERRQAEAALLDARLRGIAVETTTETIEALSGKLPIERLTSQALIAASGFRHPDTMPTDSTHVLTRVVSLVAAITGLVVLAPVLLLIVIAIRIDSKGPIFFTQSRIGMAGKPFRLVKFRTMRECRRYTSEWVSDNADRITRVGRWLRRFRLDELPQFFNVVLGHMNLVGPRPHPTSNAALFLANIPHYRLRFTVRPGITGWAQVRYGYANGLEEETEKMRYDLYYIKHRSLWLDFRILAETIELLLFDNRSHERVRAAPEGNPWPLRGVTARDAAVRWGR